MLISFRCSFMPSALAAGMMMAARRATGANRAVEIYEVVTVVPDMGGREPIGARYRRECLLSDRASSETRSRSGGRRRRREGDLQQSGEALLKSLLCFSILLGMKRARLQSGKLQPAQHLPMVRSCTYGEPLGTWPAGRGIASAHLVGLGIGASDHQCLASICASSRAGVTRATARRQAGDPGGIVAMHPIAQRLAIHPGQFRRFSARPALQDQGDGQQAPNLSAIAALCCELTQCLSRMLRPCDRDCLAQLILLAAIGAGRIEPQSARLESRSRGGYE